MAERRRASITDMPDVSGFAPEDRAAKKAALDVLAAEEGFRTRHGRDTQIGSEKVEYDARSRRKPRGPMKGLNISVPEDVRLRFWRYGDQHDLGSGAEILIWLLEKAERSE